MGKVSVNAARALEFEGGTLCTCDTFLFIEWVRVFVLWTISCKTPRQGNLVCAP